MAGRSIIPEERKLAEKRAAEAARERAEIIGGIQGAIGAYCFRTNRNVAQLAGIIGMNATTLYRRLRDPEKLSVGEWLRLRREIGTDLRL